jgi:hypothetical protein
VREFDQGSIYATRIRRLLAVNSVLTEGLPIPEMIGGMDSSSYASFLARAVDTSPTPEVTGGASGYFSTPQQGLDPRLFEGDKFRPSVRSWVLDTLYGYWETKYNDPRSWSTVWVAGSGVSYQWAAARGGLGDLDVLMGVDFDDFYAANPKFLGINEADMCDIFNVGLHTDLFPLTERTHIPVNSIPWAEKAESPQRKSNSSASNMTPVNPAEQLASYTDIVAPPLGKSLWTKAPPSAQGGVGRAPQGGSASVDRHESGVPGSVDLAAPRTSESKLSSASTVLTKQTTTNFWNNKITGAQFVEPPTPRDKGSSMSTTATSMGTSVGSSASGATTGSDSSATISQGLNGFSNTFDSRNDGPFSVTFYVNPLSADIRRIHPYAAYDLTDNKWTVKPPVLPQDPRSLYPKEFVASVDAEKTRARGMVSRYQGLRSQMDAMAPGSPGWLNLVAQVNIVVSQADALFSDIHSGRRNAFSSNGSGYGDYYNFRWQSHKESGTSQALHALAAVSHEAHQAQASDIYGQNIATSRAALTQAALWRR